MLHYGGPEGHPDPISDTSNIGCRMTADLPYDTWAPNICCRMSDNGPTIPDPILRHFKYRMSEVGLILRHQTSASDVGPTIIIMNVYDGSSGVGSGTVGKARAVPLFLERNYQSQTYRAAIHKARVV